MLINMILNFNEGGEVPNAPVVYISDTIFYLAFEKDGVWYRIVKRIGEKWETEVQRVEP